MLICADCVDYFLACSVSSYPVRYGLCELCGQKAHGYDIAIPENKKKKGNGIHNAADIIREAIRVMYYPDIDQNDGLKLAEYTIKKVSGRSTEEFAKYVLNKEVMENEKTIVVW
ncbi:MAG: hypothetical protein JJE19_04495 [Methanosarcinales archaeon]|nr:hypothetical protein [Methanosarcinales archaeon]